MSKKFGQVKRYSLLGSDSFLVACKAIFEACQEKNIQVCVGMAHRGRLELLDFVGATQAIFYKLLGGGVGNKENNGGAYKGGAEGSGDVLSHLQWRDDERGIILLPNSSHLEAINAVQQGHVWAQQNIYGKESMALCVHGDASISGQGIVQETLMMSQLEGFSTRGSIHLIVNNQLGFTATPSQTSSSPSPGSPAKMIESPIIHVNASDPIAVWKVAQLAFEYRQRFEKDVFIDLIGYRRLGHNELDEPAFTQPHLYTRRISGRRWEGQQFAEQIGLDYEEISQSHRKAFESSLRAAQQQARPDRQHSLQPPFSDGNAGKTEEKSSSQIPLPSNLKYLQEIGKASVTTPATISVHPRLQKYHCQARLSLIKDGLMDWSLAETLSIGHLLAKGGFVVRWTGQDVERGTFSHRHWIIHSQEPPYTPCAPLCENLQRIGAANKVEDNKMRKGQHKQFYIQNSHLSEAGVLAFEWGASITDDSVRGKRILCVWEAQFGDFVNGAQVIIDAFIASSAQKWSVSSNIVILLPHGMDGAGPEHSSCRLERFLQGSNEPISLNAGEEREKLNWRIVNPTTPSNYFHLLQRQASFSGEDRIPLIVAAPKTLLRHPSCKSKIEECLDRNGFEPTLIDTFANAKDKEDVSKVIFCTGKIYYDLAKALSPHSENCIIVRLEELCPFPSQRIHEIIRLYAAKKVGRWIWCQEESENAGAYAWIQPRLAQLLPAGACLEYVGRRAAAAPATGYPQQHALQTQEILKKLTDQ